MLRFVAGFFVFIILGPALLYLMKGPDFDLGESLQNSIVIGLMTMFFLYQGRKKYLISQEKKD